MEDVLKRVVPGLRDIDRWAEALTTAMERFEINTPNRAAAFLAQILHESAEFKHLVEDLGYSANSLRAIWPRRFPTVEAAAAYAKNPEAVANFVYANRLGNGDAASGDGWRYRGRGLLSITGRGNYRSIGDALDRPYDAEPDLLATPPDAALAAAHFWASRGLNQLADDMRDDAASAFEQITRIINGGVMRLKERHAYLDRARKAYGLG